MYDVGGLLGCVRAANVELAAYQSEARPTRHTRTGSKDGLEAPPMAFRVDAVLARRVF